MTGNEDAAPGTPLADWRAPEGDLMRRTHGVTFVLGLLLAAPLAAATRTRPEIDKELATLRDSLHKGNVDDAVAAGERAVKADPDCAACHELLGEAYGARAMKASFFSALSAAKKCRNEFERTIALDGANLEARWGLIEWYLNVPGIAGGDVAKAKQQAAALARLDPTLGHTASGFILEHEKDAVGAEREYRAAYSTNPTEAESFAALVAFLGRQQRWEEARKTCREALAARPEDPLPRYHLGRLAALSGAELASGLAALDEYLVKEPGEKLPSWADAQWRRGQILEKLDRKAEAKGAFEAALKLVPGHNGATKSLKAMKG